MTTPPPRARPSFVRQHVRRIALFVLIVAAALALAMVKLRPLDVTVTPVVRGKAIDAVYATGTVEAEERVNVKAKTSGSVTEIVVREGSAVNEGDLLARIDNPAVAFDLERGKVEFSAATAQASRDSPGLAALRGQQKTLLAELDVARQELGRAEKLASSGALAPSELDRARSRVTQAEGNLAANLAQQRALRIDLSANVERQAAQVKSLTSRVTDTEVRAPLDGVVLVKSVELGEVVMVNQPLFKVGDTRSLVLEVAVDEADVARVHDGTQGRGASEVAVSLYAFPGRAFRGSVFEVLPDADRERKAFLVKVRLDQPPEGLRSGMSAEVNVIAEEHEGARLAPSEAEQEGFVWVVRDGRARKQPVEIGVRDLLRVEVLSGLSEGELVVVEGQDKLEEGRRVRTTVRAPDKLAPLPDRTTKNAR